MATNASLGIGTTYAVYDTSVSPEAYTDLGEVTNIDLGTDEIELIDVTHMDSPNNTREYIAGLKDGGEVTLTLNYDPSNATDVLLRDLQTAGTTVNHRVTFNDGSPATTLTYPAIVRSIGRQVPVDSRMEMTVTIKKAGAETWA